MNVSRKRAGLIAGASATILGVAALLPTDSGGPASVDASSVYTPYNVFVYMGQSLPGDSVDQRHRKWIEASSVEWGGTMSTSGATGRLAPRVAFSDVVLSKGIDRATPGLYARLAAGTRIPSVIIDVVQPGENPARTKFTLSDVMVSSIKAAARRAEAYSQDGNGEQFSLNFNTIKIEHWEPGSATVTSCSSWDKARNAKSSC